MAAYLCDADDRLALRPGFLCYADAVLFYWVDKNICRGQPLSIRSVRQYVYPRSLWLTHPSRRGLPRYGFFILNRSSSQNYMHLLTAEDNLEVQDSYVIFRAKGSRDGECICDLMVLTRDSLLLPAPVLGLWAGEPDHRQHLGDTLLG
jgi:hypothetical protein